MLKKMIATTLVGMTLSSISFAQDARKGTCHIIVAPNEGSKIERSVDLDPEQISTSLGNVGGFELEAYYFFDDQQNVGRVFLEVKSKDGVTHDFTGENAVTWTIFNYRNQFLSVSCSEKTK